MRDFNAFDDEETKTIETVRPTQSIMEEEIVVNVEHQHKPKKRKNRLEGKRKNSKGDLAYKFFRFNFCLGSIGLIVLVFLLYGPFIGFREWLVTTAMTTMTHQYLATWFYDDDTIQYILNKNKVEEIVDYINSKINF